MTLYEFKLLSDYEHYDLLFAKGDFITSRIDKGSTYALYSLEKFFVKLEYNPKNNKIISKVSFVDGEKLDYFLAIKIYSNLLFIKLYF